LGKILLHFHERLTLRDHRSLRRLANPGAGQLSSRGRHRDRCGDPRARVGSMAALPTVRAKYTQGRLSFHWHSDGSPEFCDSGGKAIA
jgi:hypothetical protein